LAARRTEDGGIIHDSKLFMIPVEQSAPGVCQGFLEG
jgi:hypothetical protein